MRIEGSVTAISWIPSEAIEGLPKLPFELGVGHYDEPPPDKLEPGDLGRLRDADRFREANLLEAWIDVEDGAIVGASYRGGGLVGSTTFKLGPKSIVVPGVPFEVLRSEPEISGSAVFTGPPEPVTEPVAFESAAVEPDAFDAVTSTRRFAPRSPDWTL